MFTIRPHHGNYVFPKSLADTEVSTVSNVKLESEGSVRAKVEDPKSCEGYTVLDAVGNPVGRAKSVFVNDFDEIEYMQIKTGLLGRKPILIPAEMVSVDDEKRTLALR